MRISNSKERLQEMMDILGLKQADICNKTGIQKSAISNYLNGAREPRQDQVSLICDAYGINPTWFMGYDVPMYLNDNLASEDHWGEYDYAYLNYATEEAARYENIIFSSVKKYCQYLMRENSTLYNLYSDADFNNITKQVLNSVKLIIDTYQLGYLDKAELDKRFEKSQEKLANSMYKNMEKLLNQINDKLDDKK